MKPVQNTKNANTAALISVLNLMSINFLEMLQIEDGDGTMKPARYVIEDGKITGVITED